MVELFGADLAKGPSVEGLIEAMDAAGVDLGVLTSGLSDPERAHRAGGYAAEDFVAIAEAAPRPVPRGRHRRAGRAKPGRNCARVRSWPSTRRWRWCGSRRWSSSTS